MLNGATTKLRNAQANTPAVRRKRSRLPRALPCRRSGAARSRVGAAEVGQRMRAACFGLRGARQAGVAIAGRAALCALAMAASSSNPHGEAARRAVRGRARPAEPLQLRRSPGIYFDWSKTHLDEGAGRAVRRARRGGWASPRRATRCSPAGSSTRARAGAATHVAERGSGAPDDVDLAAARRQRMRALVDAIEAGAFGDVTGVLHIGIGGSVLGPALLVDALGRRRRGVEVRVPVEHRRRGVRRSGERARSGDDPGRRRLEDLHHRRDDGQSRRARSTGCASGGVADPYGRVIAVTAQPEAAVEAGIDETRVLPFGEGVGGRYSLWSVGRRLRRAGAGLGRVRGIARRRGRDGPAFPLRRAGATTCRCSPPSPTASTSRQRGCQTRAVFAYDERLRLLPFYLQQLEMESNGKSVTADGKPVEHPTAPVTWGGIGTDAQHAVFQLLHQGTVLVPVEFVAVRDAGRRAGPRAPPACCCSTAFAQGAALMRGRPSDDPQRAYPGNRPSATILLDRLDAADARRADRLLRAPHLRQRGAARDQSVRPVRGRAGQGDRARPGRGRGEDWLDPSTQALMERAGL